jgi:hypothetical protein
MSRSLAAAAVLSAALVCAGAAPAQDREAGFDYGDYAAVLSTYVNDLGMVDYKGLKANSARLRTFVRALGMQSRAEYNQWTDQEKIAFWINAYNGLTLKAIIDNYPIKPTFPARLRYPNNSIRQIKGIWDGFEFRVMGRAMTLEDIEHGTLRKDFEEPMIHMALVCAAMGCPPLRNEPYEGSKLTDQLADQVRKFMGNSRKFRVDRGGGDVYLSPIFKWFGEDFVAKYGTSTKFSGPDEEERAVLNFVSRYLAPGDRAYLETGSYDIEYLDYDWTLNEQ